MKIEEYQHGDHDTLRRICADLPAFHSLRYPEFVDNYYASSEYCRLYIMHDASQRVSGVVGVEKMPFEGPNGPVEIGFGSNYHAFDSGAGGILFLQWVRSCGLGMNFGGSPDAHRIIDHQKWTRFGGIRTLQLNSAWAQVPGEPAWRKLAKSLLSNSPFKTRVDRCTSRMLKRNGLDVEVQSETAFSTDMLEFESPFDVRVATKPDYLNWRYATDLSHVRYHLFRIMHGGESVGFVLLNAQPNRVLVAHCDATDAWILVKGIAAALGQLCRGRLSGTGVLLTTSHSVISSVFQEFGFRTRRNGRGLAIGGPGKQSPFPTDTSNWLINEDWGDNGLRAPFLGCSQIEGIRAAA